MTVRCLLALAGWHINHIYSRRVYTRPSYRPIRRAAHRRAFWRHPDSWCAPAHHRSTHTTPLFNYAPSCPPTCGRIAMLHTRAHTSTQAGYIFWFASRLFTLQPILPRAGLNPLTSALCLPCAGLNPFAIQFADGNMAGGMPTPLVTPGFTETLKNLEALAAQPNITIQNMMAEAPKHLQQRGKDSVSTTTASAMQVCAHTVQGLCSNRACVGLSHVCGS